MKISLLYFVRENQNPKPKPVALSYFVMPRFQALLITGVDELEKAFECMLIRFQ